MNVQLTRRELLMGAAALPAVAAKKPAVRPSVMLIVLEDVGAWMLGSYGNREIRTPNLDVLARSGARFASSYAASATVAPARASLLTGLAPKRAALENQPMLSDVLAGAGYECGYAGNWDQLSKSPHGFKSWETAADYSAVTAKASQFLDGRKAGQPFLLVVSHAFPVGVPSKFIDMYASTRFDTIGWDRPSPKAAANKEALKDIVGSIRKAAAALTALDEQVLPLVRKLDERGVRDETVVVLTSTNGSLLGRHGLWGDARASEPANMFEEVVAVPLFWQWQGHVPPEAVRPEVVSAYDLVPAVCALTGSAQPAGKLPGRSYLPAVLNMPFPKKQPWRSLAFGEFGDAVMARDKRYKLVLRAAGKGPNELYDDITDPREKVNQYDNPGFVTIRDGMTREIEGWTKNY
jgi:arylsulfatase A-like enzyme